MPKKQLCENCGGQIKYRPVDNDWVHTKPSYLKNNDLCVKPEPQILCKWCGKPKGEHVIMPFSKRLCCSDDKRVSDTEFEPAPNSAPDKVKR